MKDYSNNGSWGCLKLSRDSNGNAGVEVVIDSASRSSRAGAIEQTLITRIPEAQAPPAPEAVPVTHKVA